MKFTVDHHFVIGHTHLGNGMPCQDYATSGLKDDKYAYAIVSDGCSTGGQTDVGSRILAHSFAKLFRRYFATHTESFANMPSHIDTGGSYLASSTMDSLGLSINDMLATVVYAVITPDFTLTSIIGDGVVVFGYDDGSLEMQCVDWDQNAPYYIAYSMADDTQQHQNNLRNFQDFHKDNLSPITFQHYNMSNMSDTEVEPNIQKFTQDSHNYLRTLFIGNREDGRKINFIAVFSDGVTQVDGMNWKEVVIALLKIKGKGSFAKRRMIAFHKESMRNNKRGPLDDIAYAIIRIDN